MAEKKIETPEKKNITAKNKIIAQEKQKIIIAPKIVLTLLRSASSLIGAIIIFCFSCAIILFFAVIIFFSGVSIFFFLMFKFCFPLFLQPKKVLISASAAALETFILSRTIVVSACWMSSISASAGNPASAAKRFLRSCSALSLQQVHFVPDHRH